MIAELSYLGAKEYEDLDLLIDDREELVEDMKHQDGVGLDICLLDDVLLLSVFDVDDNLVQESTNGKVVCKVAVELNDMKRLVNGEDNLDSEVEEDILEGEE